MTTPLTPPLTLFRVATGKTAIAGITQTARIIPLEEDAGDAATRDAAFFKALPIEHRAAYAQLGLPKGWSDQPWEKTLRDRGMSLPAVEKWYAQYAARLDEVGCEISMLVIDEEGLFAGLGIWRDLTLEHAREVCGSKYWPHVPASVRRFTPEQFAAKELPAYIAWQNWTHGWRANLLRRCITEPVHTFFPRCNVGNFGETSRPMFDVNGWPLPVATMGGIGMPVCYHNLFGGERFADGYRYAWDVLSSGGASAWYWISDAAWANDGDEFDAERMARLRGSELFYDRAFKLRRKFIFWEGNRVDPESDAIVSRAVAAGA